MAFCRLALAHEQVREIRAPHNGNSCGSRLRRGGPTDSRSATARGRPGLCAGPAALSPCLNCLVAIELKVMAFTPEHLGKLNFYLEALDREEVTAP